MNAVIHAIGTVNESKRIACRAWQTVCGDALDTHIDGADTRDDQTNVVFCALYVIILQALVESAYPTGPMGAMEILFFNVQEPMPVG